MKRTALSLLTLVFVFMLSSVAFAGEVEKTFDQTVCHYFGVKQSVVDELRAAGLNDEDIPVALHIAKRGKTSVQRIATMKVRGDSWKEIVTGRNMNLEIFYIPVSGQVESFTYGSLLAQYKAVPQSKWNTLPLSDTDIVNLVNLKMASSDYDYNIFKVMALRDNGKAFTQICHEVKEAKELYLAQQRKDRRNGVVNAGM